MVIKAKEIMVKKLLTIDENASVKKAAQMMKKVSSLLVKRKGKIYGIITDSDIIKKVVAKGLNPSKVKVKEVCSHPLITVKEDDDLDEISYKMKKHRIRKVVVINKKGKIVGIVSATDIARYVPDLIEWLQIQRERKGIVERPALEALEDESLTGICEECSAYTNNLKLVEGRWLCETCRGEKEY